MTATYLQLHIRGRHNIPNNQRGRWYSTRHRRYPCLGFGNSFQPRSQALVPIVVVDRSLAGHSRHPTFDTQPRPSSGSRFQRNPFL